MMINRDKNAVAIIAMTGRFPGADDLTTYWDNIKNYREAITRFTDEQLTAAGVLASTLRDPNYVKVKGIIENIDLFDASFFDYSPNEAALTDPQHRIFLELCWTALERAGYCAEKYPGSIGVFAGVSDSSYLYTNILPSNMSVDLQQLGIATNHYFLSTKVSYKLNLTGPSLNINTACSTSLVAIATAAKQLLNYECDLALAGGISIALPQTTGYLYQAGGILAPDGHCRAFDAKSAGTVPADGAGVVVLKRLEDALQDGDKIEALIIGAAINNDGSRKVGFTAPSVEGQAMCIAEALSLAEVPADTINYVETHGTGTFLGDPIEITALTEVYRRHTKKKQFCAIGSVKSNIGHTNNAAGVAGLIKTVLALKHRQLPPSLNYTAPNPNIDFANTPFYVNTELKPWIAEGVSRRAGVSSFGIGGTNAHLILEEAPILEASSKSRNIKMLLLSAKTPTALEAATINIYNFLKDKSNGHTFLDNEFADVAYTLQVGRKDFPYRRAIVCKDVTEALAVLPAKNLLENFTKVVKADKPQNLIFMFPGQGTQYINMGLGLYQAEAVFKKAVDECCEILALYLNLDLREILFPTSEQAEFAAQQLAKTQYTQPAMFVIEYAMAQLFISWGIRPRMVLGHSSGEYVAAQIAGVFTLRDALMLVAYRGKLIGKLENGAMLSINLPEEEVKELLFDDLSIAAVNGRSLCVVAGTKSSIQALKENIEKKYNAQEVSAVLLHTSHAFHSTMMLPIVDEFRKLFTNVIIAQPKIPFISTVTGKEVSSSELGNSKYWVDHVCRAVRFYETIKNITDKDTSNIFLEVGPGNVLTTLVLRTVEDRAKNLALHSLPAIKYLSEEDKISSSQTYAALAKLWLHGIKVDWNSYYCKEQRYRIPLPTYPFERKRYWIEPVAISIGDSIKVNSDEKRQRLISEQEAHENDNEIIESITNIFRDLLGVQHIGKNENFFDLGGHSLLGLQLVAKIEKIFGIKVPLAAIYEFKTISDLARLIMAPNISDHPFSSLVSLRAAGHKNPMFFIHPIGGTVFCYMPLAKYLDHDRPFYAIQHPSISDHDLVLDSIEAMAELYLMKIKAIRPHGPYLLGGHSYGGIVAFEIASKLRAQGEEVEFLGLIDSWGAIVQDFLENKNVEKKLDNYISLVKKCSLADKHDTEKFWSSFHKKMIKMIIAYKPKKADIKLTLFKAQDFENFFDSSRDDSNGWKDLTNFDIDRYSIPGNHDSMLEEPNVQTLAEKINECLEKIS
jgi:phthiocerol/phenolphthiocerol synthesis type-I polyketide synthase E